jgi:RNA recognition motif-containing protein
MLVCLIFYMFLCVEILFYVDGGRGFAFIEFEDADDAWHAQQNMNDSELFGKVIRVTVSKGVGLSMSEALWEQNADEYYQQTMPEVEAQTE